MVALMNETMLPCPIVVKDNGIIQPVQRRFWQKDVHVVHTYAPHVSETVLENKVGCQLAKGKSAQ